MEYNYLLEQKLRSEAPELHRVFSSNILVCQNMLLKYRETFPEFTDHTALHSLEVIAFCNNLIGEQIDKLNTDEIFVLLMAAYLHDVGMGIDKAGFDALRAGLPQVQAYLDKNPDAEMGRVIRTFHNDFSGAFITRYQMLFDFPSEKHLFAVIQVSRGHRKTDLYDEAEYPAAMKLDNGNVLRLPYLAALIRLADELDIAADRNLQFIYDISRIHGKKDIEEFKKHMAIKEVRFEENHFLVLVDDSEPQIYEALIELFDKLKETLDYCVDVTAKRTDFTINQTDIIVKSVRS